jgi:hypothetical protein
MQVINIIVIMFSFLFGAGVLYVTIEKWFTLSPKEIVTLLFLSLVGIGLSGYLFYLLVN